MSNGQFEKIAEDIVSLFFKEEISNLLIKYKQYGVYYENTKAPYPQITEYVLKNDEEINIDSLIDKYNNLEEFETENSWGQFLRSFEKHYRLALIQKKFILENVNQLDDSLISVKKEVKDIENIKGTIYTDFISILGIFSALLFGLFVGFDVFKEFVSSMASTSKISRSVIMGSLLIIGLISLVFLLFEGIAKLTGKNMKSCCDDNFCNHGIHRRYPVFFVSILVLIIAIIVATVLLIINMNGWVYNSFGI